jgi:rubrerythrin
MGSECIERGILEQAMRMEEESRQFYMNASKKVANRPGRAMLESLARDEEQHLARLRQMQEQDYEAALAGCIPEFEDAAGKIRAVFAKYGGDVAEEVTADTGDLEALDIAMEMERKGFDLYKEAASNVEDANAQKVFIFLAGEEEKHFEILQNMHKYLSDPRNWFLEEEQGLLDGG